MPVQWDLNGDGVFGDATGPSVSLELGLQLTALGLNQGAGSYPISVRATTSQGSADFTTTLTILATPPVLTVTSRRPQPRLVNLYAINFSAFRNRPRYGDSSGW